MTDDGYGRAITTIRAGLSLGAAAAILLALSPLWDIATGPAAEPPGAEFTAGVGTSVGVGAAIGAVVIIAAVAQRVLWQHLLGMNLHWIVLVMSVILLLAVGSDYNLLLVSRFIEERRHGLKTGIIRSMAGSGSVVTSAGLVFAATMASFVFGDLLSIAQVGSTIALGLLFDTLIVRSFMTPSIAAALGRWFWWPQIVRTRARRGWPKPPEPRDPEGVTTPISTGG